MREGEREPQGEPPHKARAAIAYIGRSVGRIQMDVGGRSWRVLLSTRCCRRPPGHLAASSPPG